MVGGISKKIKHLDKRRVHTFNFRWVQFYFKAKRRETRPQMVTISRSLLCGIVGLMVLKQTFLFVSHMAQVLLLFPQCGERPLR